MILSTHLNVNFSVLQPVLPEFNRIVKNLKLYHSFICQPALFDFVVTIIIAKFVGIRQHVFGKVAWHCKVNRFYVTPSLLRPALKLSSGASHSANSLSRVMFAERFSYIISSRSYRSLNTYYLFESTVVSCEFPICG